MEENEESGGVDGSLDKDSDVSKSLGNVVVGTTLMSMGYKAKETRLDEEEAELNLTMLNKGKSLGL